MLRYRQSQQDYVDKRVRVLASVIENIKSVKLYAYETHYQEKVNELRKLELKKLRHNGLNRAGMTGVGYLIPMLAAVCEFVWVFIRFLSCPGD